MLHYTQLFFQQSIFARFVKYHNSKGYICNLILSKKNQVQSLFFFCQHVNKFFLLSRGTQYIFVHIRSTSLCVEWSGSQTRYSTSTYWPMACYAIPSINPLYIAHPRLYHTRFVPHHLAHFIGFPRQIMTVMTRRFQNYVISLVLLQYYCTMYIFCGKMMER